MAGKLTPAGAIGKWVVVPALLALIGYYVLAPLIGGSSDQTTKGAHESSNAPTNADRPGPSRQN